MTQIGTPKYQATDRAMYLMHAVTVLGRFRDMLHGNPVWTYEITFDDSRWGRAIVFEHQLRDMTTEEIVKHAPHGMDK